MFVLIQNDIQDKCNKIAAYENLYRNVATNRDIANKYLKFNVGKHVKHLGDNALRIGEQMEMYHHGFGNTQKVLKALCDVLRFYKDALTRRIPKIDPTTKKRIPIFGDEAARHAERFDKLVSDAYKDWCHLRTTQNIITFFAAIIHDNWLMLSKDEDVLRWCASQGISKKDKQILYQTKLVCDADGLPMNLGEVRLYKKLGIWPRIWATKELLTFQWYNVNNIVEKIRLITAKNHRNYRDCWTHWENGFELWRTIARKLLTNYNQKLRYHNEEEMN